MKTHTFGGWVEFFRGDYGNTPVDFELTDEEYAAVMRHIEANNKPWDADDEESEEEYLAFCDCEDLQDLYDRVLAATEAQIRAELEEENEEARRLYGEAAHLHGNGEDVLAYYNVGVNFEYSD